jgi:hypothetical protein
MIEVLNGVQALQLGGFLMVVALMYGLVIAMIVGAEG